mmetsp:Transcript_8468/g.23009  ORF Transcript_8468/g.23009 Transcript_8468/m.23009 type:complete len:207 (+) Transcript_8468:1276-1896(+)
MIADGAERDRQCCGEGYAEEDVHVYQDGALTDIEEERRANEKDDNAAVDRDINEIGQGSAPGQPAGKERAEAQKPARQGENLAVAVVCEHDRNQRDEEATGQKDWREEVALHGEALEHEAVPAHRDPALRRHDHVRVAQGDSYDGGEEGDAVHEYRNRSEAGQHNPIALVAQNGRRRGQGRMPIRAGDAIERLETSNCQYQEQYHS